jgi:hypothetical protein
MGQEYGKSDILKIVYCEFYVSDILTRKNCFRYLKLMSPLNVDICTTISYTLWVECCGKNMSWKQIFASSGSK